MNSFHFHESLLNMSDVQALNTQYASTAMLRSWTHFRVVTLRNYEISIAHIYEKLHCELTSFSLFERVPCTEWDKFSISLYSQRETEFYFKTQSKCSIANSLHETEIVQQKMKVNTQEIRSTRRSCSKWMHSYSKRSENR